MIDIKFQHKYYIIRYSDFLGNVHFKVVNENEYNRFPYTCNIIFKSESYSDTCSYFRDYIVKY